MDELVVKLKTSKDARIFAKNARRKERLDLEAQALQRANELQAIEEGYQTPAEQAIAAALYNYEQEQSQLKQRPFRANRTRQMLIKYGALATAERMVLSPQQSKDFEVLSEAGLEALTFEAIVDRFPDEFSVPAIEASRARLEGRPPPPSSNTVRHSFSEIVEDALLSSLRLDDEALSFVEGFKKAAPRFLANWLPRYRASIQKIAASVASGRPEEIFDLIWKTVDNSISNVGQGVLKFEVVDQMRDAMIQVIRDIAQDGSPANFDQMIERFEGWKREARIPIVPRLLIARAFAGLHPDIYHTTVDARSQNYVLAWFEEHTGFSSPRATSWAARARALVAFLDRLDVFGEDALVRNMFPWFVMDQIRVRVAPDDIAPGHIPRPESTFADLPPRLRIIRLRHNAVQTALFKKLVLEFGENRVWTECPTGTGGYADALARHPDNRCVLYEIKIADTAAGVVRQAMGQLLEYGYRLGGLEPIKVFAVGEPALDDVTRRFLARLHEDFRLDIDYLQVTVPELGPSR